MFEAIFITKFNKERMHLNAVKQILKGIKKLEKLYYINNPWSLNNVLISKEYLEKRFGSLKKASKCLSEKIQYSPITEEEKSMLNNLEYKVQEICIDNINYTFNEKYIDYTGLSFTKAERMHAILQFEKENPNYYTKELKNFDYVKNCSDPIKIYLKENEDGKNLGTIVEGNNRILKLKCDMASELANTTNKDEIKRIKNKYTIFVQAKDVKDLDLLKRR